MCRERNCREMKKTGKSLFTFTSCLILLSVIGMLYTYMAGRKPEEGEDMAEPGQMADIEEDDDIFRLVGGYDNPIDEFYLPVIFASNGEDKVAVLKSYENAWKGQLEEYLEDYRSRCRYAKDKEMSEEYFAAVQMAADAQKELMNYMGVEADGQFWYSAQIYRCAFIKDVHGEFINEEANLGVMNVGLKEMQVPAGVNYEVCGGFVNDIDRQYAVSMYEGAEADIRCRQEAFDLDWCN
ncbi:MAG: hypothetical protein K2N55_11365, partial [Lachnospiraceae bacterium]|nr:hypothetical protein [Lachnospiraceae bacterium]